MPKKPALIFNLRYFTKNTGLVGKFRAFGKITPNEHFPANSRLRGGAIGTVATSGGKYPASRCRCQGYLFRSSRRGSKPN
jgi:hypothetical protein